MPRDPIAMPRAVFVIPLEDRSPPTAIAVSWTAGFGTLWCSPGAMPVGILSGGSAAPPDPSTLSLLDGGARPRRVAISRTGGGTEAAPGARIRGSPRGSGSSGSGSRGALTASPLIAGLFGGC